jgi:hypothetical protein
MSVVFLSDTVSQVQVVIEPPREDEVAGKAGRRNWTVEVVAVSRDLTGEEPDGPQEPVSLRSDGRLVPLVQLLPGRPEAEDFARLFIGIVVDHPDRLEIDRGGEE